MRMDRKDLPEESWQDPYRFTPTVYDNVIETREVNGTKFEIVLMDHAKPYTVYGHHNMEHLFSGACGGADVFVLFASCKAIDRSLEDIVEDVWTKSHLISFEA
eukprot:TRINITY_DN2180_c0_g1_i1.p1 TRINITY_DN2180_c0_g1~~TRINITY_DN2180_c0_g1_i1.p1  ORF type:complete len:103 (+),score=11.96 TRINITY_DN2180_c0_g1_i1:141-449(+)